MVRISLRAKETRHFPEIVRDSLTSASDETDIFCPSCSIGRCSHIQRLVSTSENICLGINRVSVLKPGVFKKDMKRLEFEKTLVLCKRRYDLRAAVVHIGRSVTSGHYVSYIFKDHYSYCVSDSTVRNVTFNNAFTDICRGGCALFYG